MATSGKKGKKAKSKAIPLQEFLNQNGSVSTSQVQKKVHSWYDECEEHERGLKVVSLPTAPRASCINDDSVPQNPPYLAYLSSIHYDVTDADIYDFFAGLDICSVRLPREDSESKRLRGFGYVEFEKREHLIEAVSMPDLVIHNRRFRIQVSNENDMKRMGNRGRYDNSEGGGNWRHGNEGGNRGGDRDAESRRTGYNYRDRERNRDNEGSEGGEREETNWRSGERPNLGDTSSQPRRRGFGDSFAKDRGFGDRGGDRGDRNDRGGDRNDRGGDRNDRGGDRGRRNYDDRKRDDAPMERPKLNLQPRTIPIENPLPPPQEDKEDTVLEDEYDSSEEIKPRPTPVSAATIFGSAKPVDTAAREREIEERIEKERLAKIKELEEKKEMEKLERDRMAAEKEREKEDDDGHEEKDDTNVKDQKKAEEIVSWRNRPDEKATSDDNDKRRPTSPPQRKFSPDRRGPQRDGRRNDDRRTTQRDGQRDGRDNRNRDGGDYQRNRDYNKDRDGGNRGLQRNENNRDYNQRENNRNDYNRHEYNRGEQRSFNKEKDLGTTKEGGEQTQQRREKIDNRNREHDERDIDDRMPKYQPIQGPNLSISNKYALFLDTEDNSE